MRLLSESIYKRLETSMCGLVGLLSTTSEHGADPFDLLRSMATTLEHRGPDDVGVWFDQSHGIGFAHRRLSILDLSSAGHQPMMSSTGRYIIAFNGEIYNHKKIRADLEVLDLAPTWRGNSDTETILAAIEAYGVDTTVQICTGMFAFALWDKSLRTLLLARDRMGEKPLYYGWHGNTFLFASELKAFKAYPNFSPTINREALCLFLQNNYIPAPYSIYHNIFKLEPATLLSISEETHEVSTRKYWDVFQVSLTGLDNPFTGTPHDAVNELEILISDSVSQQMQSDVPLGAFLSGGIDSSTVVAVMQSQSSRPIRTYTIGFSQEKYNEAVYARQVADHLGTSHSEIYVSPQDALDVIPHLSDIFCEPFADPSQIPNYIVSVLAHQDVKVSLSGDAGDELFCGYTRYPNVAQLWNNLSRYPLALRLLASRCPTLLTPDVGQYLEQSLPLGRRYAQFRDTLHRRASLIKSANIDQLYSSVFSQVYNPSEWVIGAKPLNTSRTLPEFLDRLSSLERLMILDMTSYLPDDILAKVDRTGMATSLETRMPFLDHRIIEFSLRLPISYKYRDNQLKWPLRQVLGRYVPAELIDRPKMGLSVPMGDWLRGPLCDWADSLLDYSRLKREGFFHPHIIRKKWSEHKSCKSDWTPQLWSVLMFQSWLQGHV